MIFSDGRSSQVNCERNEEAEQRWECSFAWCEQKPTMVYYLCVAIRWTRRSYRIFIPMTPTGSATMNLTIALGHDLLKDLFVVLFKINIFAKYIFQATFAVDTSNVKKVINFWEWIYTRLKFLVHLLYVDSRSHFCMCQNKTLRSIRTSENLS